jgi:uncharacterized phage-like protein YoqJ
MIIAGTGHRPQKAVIGKLEAFSALQDYTMFKVAKRFLLQHGASLVITGGALGWDMAMARAAHILQIPFRVYVPFKGQESKWTASQQAKYRAMLNEAETVKIVSETKKHAPDLMFFQIRNIAMVDDCELLLALWDGKRGGGTWNCIQYAEKVERKIVNAWEEYEFSAKQA